MIDGPLLLYARAEVSGLKQQLGDSAGRATAAPGLAQAKAFELGEGAGWRLPVEAGAGFPEPAGVVSDSSRDTAQTAQDRELR